MFYGERYIDQHISYISIRKQNYHDLYQMKAFLNDTVPYLRNGEFAEFGNFLTDSSADTFKSLHREIQPHDNNNSKWMYTIKSHA